MYDEKIGPPMSERSRGEKQLTTYICILQIQFVRISDNLKTKTTKIVTHNSQYPVGPGGLHVVCLVTSGGGARTSTKLSGLPLYNVEDGHDPSRSVKASVWD